MTSGGNNIFKYFFSVFDSSVKTPLHIKLINSYYIHTRHFLLHIFGRKTHYFRRCSLARDVGDVAETLRHHLGWVAERRREGDAVKVLAADAVTHRCRVEDDEQYDNYHTTGCHAHCHADQLETTIAHLHSHNKKAQLSLGKTHLYSSYCSRWSKVIWKGVCDFLLPINLGFISYRFRGTAT